MRAIKRWQQDAELPVTGRIGVGDVAVLPGAVRVDAVTALRGDAAEAPLVTVTPTTKVITVLAKAAEAGTIRRGDQVTVTLPGDKTVDGTISAIGTTVTQDDDAGPTGEPTRAVTVTVDDDLAGIDAADVQVDLVGETRPDVLAVPVAALVALAEGGYGVQLVEAAGSSPSRPACSPAAGSRSPATGVTEGLTVGDAAMIELADVTQACLPRRGHRAGRGLASTSRAASWSRSSARPARASRPCCTSSARWTGRPPAPSHRRATTSPRSSDRQLSALRAAPDRVRLPAVPPRRGRAGAGQRRRRPALRRGRRAGSGAGAARDALRAGRARPPARPPAARAVRRRAAAGGDRPGGGRRARRCCSPTSRPATSTPPSGAGVLALLRELHAAGTTVVVITHDREIAAGLPRQVGCATARWSPTGRECSSRRCRDAGSGSRPRDVLRVGGRRPADPAAAGVPVRAGHRDRHRRDDRRGRHLRRPAGRQLDRELAALGTNLLTVAPGQTHLRRPVQLPDEAAAMIAPDRPGRRGRRRPGQRRTPRSTAPTAIPTAADRRHRGARRPARPARRPSARRSAAAPGSTRRPGGIPAVVLGARGRAGSGIGDVPGPARPQVLVGGRWFTVVGVLDPVPLAPELDTRRPGRLAGAAEPCSASTATRPPSTPASAETPVERGPRRCWPPPPTRSARRGQVSPAVRRARRQAGHRHGLHRRCCSAWARWPCWSAASGWPTRWSSRCWNGGAEIGLRRALGATRGQIRRPVPGRVAAAVRARRRRPGAARRWRSPSATPPTRAGRSVVPPWATAAGLGGDAGRRRLAGAVPGDPRGPAGPDRGARQRLTTAARGVTASIRTFTEKIYVRITRHSCPGLVNVPLVDSRDRRRRRRSDRASSRAPDMFVARRHGGGSVDHRR